MSFLGVETKVMVIMLISLVVIATQACVGVFVDDMLLVSKPSPATTHQCLTNHASANLQTFFRKVRFSADGSRAFVGANIGQERTDMSFTEGDDELLIFGKDSASQQWTLIHSLKKPCGYSRYSLPFDVSGDGRAIVVGCPDSIFCATGVDFSKLYLNRTVAVIYEETIEGEWIATNVRRETGLGAAFSVAISDDGRTVALARPTGESARSSQAGTWVISRCDTNGWHHQGHTLINRQPDTSHGGSLALSGDGSTLVFSEIRNVKGAASVDLNTFSKDSSGEWRQEVPAKIDGSPNDYVCVESMELSFDGSTLILSTSARGLQNVRVFTKSNGVWLPAPHDLLTLNEEFGIHALVVSISSGGDVALVCAAGRGHDSCRIYSRQPNSTEWLEEPRIYYAGSVKELSSRLRTILVPACKIKGFFGSSAHLAGDGRAFIVAGERMSSYNSNDIDNEEAIIFNLEHDPSQHRAQEQLV